LEQRLGARFAPAIDQLMIAVRASRSTLYPIVGLAVALALPLGLAIVHHLLGAFGLSTSAPSAVTYTYIALTSSLLAVALGRALGTTFDRLRIESVTDPLTGIYNRRYLRERLLHEVERAKRYGTPLSVLIIDLDRLKTINDEHGHDTGDLALQTLGESLRENQRSSDVSARIGGDEFVVVLPHTTAADATAIADRLRASLAHTSTAVPLTASIGIAELDATTMNAEALLAAADLALYMAKAGGRNRAVTAPKEWQNRAGIELIGRVEPKVMKAVRSLS
jgi:diguanylate cyclase (GGDEF)-like protein